jgi:hypothetical protein
VGNGKIMMATYKISYIIQDVEHPGGIVNLNYQPVAGDTIDVGGLLLEVREIFELIPANNDFYYLHATCKIIEA